MSKRPAAITQTDDDETPQLTAADLSRKYGYTSRQWTRLAASGIVPGARQPTGKNGKWFFDKVVFRRWWASRQREVSCAFTAGVKRIGSAPNVRIETTAEVSRQRTERLLTDVLGRG
jgi:hypothetical protein